MDQVEPPTTWSVAATASGGGTRRRKKPARIAASRDRVAMTNSS
jgi:hypothetical protein